MNAYALPYFLSFAACVLVALSACAPLPQVSDKEMESSSNPSIEAPPPPAGARSVEALDTTTKQQRAAAVDGRSGLSAKIGQTVASLGDPTQPGLWIETPLTSTVQLGRVTRPESGKSIELELRPIDGPSSAGSRVSLAALRLLEVPLTDLVTLNVYAR